MWLLVAAELPSTPDNTQFYLLFAGGVVAAIASVAVAYITRGRGSAAPTPSAENGTGKLRERVAVTEATLKVHGELHEDSEDRDDVQDRWLTRQDHTLERHTETLAAIVRHLDRDHDGWRV